MDAKPKAVIFDLDGTLAESKQPMAPAMAELLVKLISNVENAEAELSRGSSEPVEKFRAGSYVAVMSGASWPQFEKQFLTAFPAGTNFSNLYIFPDNAAQCFTYKDGGWHEEYNMAFSTDEVTDITAMLINEIEEANFPQPAETWGKQIENRGGQVSFSPLGQQAPLEEKKQWHAAHDAQRSHLRDILAEKLPNYSVRTGGETTIDITRKGITKAYGLGRFSERTGMPISEMVYVGDALQEGGNDSVVIDTGVQIHPVSGPQDTAEFIKQLLSN